ncbi:MAG: hypothetical protein U5R46_06650 [Gammaproteobacteria bacterium]|nr:hypothetical protein [Gammaproteobacteria bacterium]
MFGFEALLDKIRYRYHHTVVGQMWRLAGEIILNRPIGASTPPWLPVLAWYRSRRQSRCPKRYDALIDQFAVEVNPRYRRNAQLRGETYCNIFVWDVTRAMDAEIPHWVTDGGQSTRAAHGREMNANAVIGWLQSRGPRHGWREVEPHVAQAHANRGAPAIVVWRNEPEIGHMAIVRPGDATEEGLPVSDAGETNHGRTRAAYVFTKGWQFGELKYFAHD